MGAERRMYKVFVGKPKGKRPLEDQGIDGSGIKMDLGQIDWGGGDSID
jgi:hypothetical protein